MPSSYLGQRLIKLKKRIRWRSSKSFSNYVSIYQLRANATDENRNQKSYKCKMNRFCFYEWRDKKVTNSTRATATI